MGHGLPIARNRMSTLGNNSIAIEPVTPGESMACRRSGILLGMANLPACLLVFIGAFLRESDLFWRNEGGWSIWMRNLVEFAFYPVFVVLLGSVTLSAGWIVIGKPAQSPLGLLIWGLVVVQVASLFGIAGVVLLNNVLNVLAGRPVHDHGF